MQPQERPSRESAGKAVTSRTLVRGIRVLEAVASAPGPIGVTDVAAQTRLDKGTASRLLAILRDLGYVRQSQADRQYELGARCLWLAQGYSDSQEELASRAVPHMAALRDSTGETVHLAVREGRSIVAIAQEQSDRELRVQSAIGTRLPIHLTATGRAILALMPAAEREAILSELRVETAAGGEAIDLAEIEADLADARLNGWVAVDLHDGVLRIAAAILDARDRPIAALSVSGPSHRMKDRTEDMGAKAAAAARRVNANVGD